MLRRKGKSHEAKETRGNTAKGSRFEKRDKPAYSRSGSRSPGSGYGSERPGRKQSLLCRFGRAQDSVLHCREDLRTEKAETMENAIVAALSAFPAQLVKAITRYRGTGFANWRRMEERLHCEVYFTDPYCAGQKGTIENLNGLLREFYPRDRTLSRVAPPY